MILLWGFPHDPALGAVSSALTTLGAQFFVLDQRLASETCLEISVGEDIAGSIECRDAEIALESLTAAYIRPHAAGPAGSPHEQAVADALLLWSELADAVVVNRPSSMAANRSKPYQLARIAAHVSTPDTLVTSTADDACAFAEEHDDVVYKSVSGVRSIVSRLGTAFDSRVADLRWCPTQFQEYVAGDDYRVHVVGVAVYASKIESTSDDYRYPTDQDVPIVSPALVPPHVEQLCLDLAAEAQLLFAGIDLRRTPDDRWYCFEVNPSPAFTYYEHRTGQPIAAALAELLAAHPGDLVTKRRRDRRKQLPYLVGEV